MQLRDLHCCPQLNRRVGIRQLRNTRLELPCPERRRFRGHLEAIAALGLVLQINHFLHKYSPTNVVYSCSDRDN